MKHDRIRWWRVWTGALLAVSIACSFSSDGGASGPATETVLASMSGANAPEERWGAASCQRESSASFHWIRCATRGSGSPGFLSNPRAYDPPLDLTGKFLKTRLRVDDLSQIGGIELRLSSDGFHSSYFAFTLPLFADQHFGALQDGTWTPITLSLATARVVGKPDRAAIDAVGLFFADAGKGPVRVEWAGLSAVEQAARGAVSFTFDDGTLSHSEIAAPEMERFGFRGTAYVMPDQIGQTGYMSLAQIRELRDRYRWDVAAHHAVPFTEFAAADLEATILGVQRYLREQGFGGGAAHLAYPLSKQEPEVVRPLVRKHFTTARIAGAGPETLPPADPHLLRAVNVLDTTSAEELGEVAQRARENGEWAILMFHHLTETAGNELEYPIERFRRALELIDETGVEVVPVSEGWALAKRRAVVTAPAKAAD